jgi:hypothetical protein
MIWNINNLLSVLFSVFTITYLKQTIFLGHFVLQLSLPYYYYYYYVIIVVSCHRPFIPVTSLEPTAIPTAQASSFRLQRFPYYV